MFTPEQWRVIRRALKLSDREFQIAQLVFDDVTEAAMASRLGISAHTVHTYLERLYRKLEVNSRSALVVRVVGEFIRRHEIRGVRA